MYITMYVHVRYVLRTYLPPSLIRERAADIRNYCTEYIT